VSTLDGPRAGGRSPAASRAWSLLYLLVPLPVALGFVCVHRYGVNVPFVDQWAIVQLFAEQDAGSLSLGDLFAQNNEHRIMFPRVGMLALGRLTRYDTVAEMYLMQFGFLAILALLVLVARQTLRRAALFVVAAAFLVFSFRQLENMLFGIQIVVLYFTEVFALLALVLLHLLARRTAFVPYLVGAIASAAIACFSSLFGVLVWPAGVIQLLLGVAAGARRKAALLVWSIAGALAMLVYFADYTRPGTHPPVAYAFRHPVETVDFLATLLGGSLFGSHALAFAAGVTIAAAGVIAVALTVSNRHLGGMAFWIGLGALGVLSLAAVTAGRLGFGLKYALLSRYSSFSILVVLAVLALLTKAVFEGRTAPALAKVALIFLLAWIGLSIPVTYVEGFEAGKAIELERRKLAFAVLTYRSQPDEFLLVGQYPWPDALSEFTPRIQRILAGRVRALVPELRELRLSVFAERGGGALPDPELLTPSRRRSSCVVDSINRVPVAGQPPPIVIGQNPKVLALSGWCIDPEARKPAGGVYLNLDGRLYPAFHGTERKDISSGLAEPAYERSGWERFIVLPKGAQRRHTLSVLSLSHDRTRRYRPAGRTVFYTGFDLPSPVTPSN